MKATPLAVMACIFSILACIISFLRTPNDNVEALIQEALDTREQQLIQNLAPQIAMAVKELANEEQLQAEIDPTSIEELFAPLFRIYSTMDQ